jgi:hypothetical protein
MKRKKARPFRDASSTVVFQNGVEKIRLKKKARPFRCVSSTAGFQRRSQTLNSLFFLFITIINRNLLLKILKYTLRLRVSAVKKYFEKQTSGKACGSNLTLSKISLSASRVKFSKSFIL